MSAESSLIIPSIKRGCSYSPFESDTPTKPWPWTPTFVGRPVQKRPPRPSDMKPHGP